MAVIPMLAYEDGAAAINWLTNAFGFDEQTRFTDDDGTVTHAELETGSGTIMLATPSPDYEGPALHRTGCAAAAAWSSVPWVVDGVLVYVDDVEAHFDRATRAGAPLLSGIEAGPDGSRLYRSEDVEGHRWMFMQRRA